MRQQSGRAGRREQPSMAIYVAFDGPMDQHFMMHPEDLLGKPIESAQVDALTLFQSHFSIEYILPFST
jgi:DEAD/DEAH box helicase domain-containing protein